MKARFFSVLAAVLFSMTLAAQTTYFGVKGGLSLANFNNDYTNDLVGDLKTENNAGVSVGVFADLPIVKGLSFQPELNYVEKGVSLLKLNDVYMNHNNLTWRYFEVPLLAKYRLTSDKGNIFFTTGPSFGYAWDGVQDVQNWPSTALGQGGEGGSFRVSDEMGYDFRSDYDINGQKDNRWDVGLVVGAGIDFKAGPGNFLIDARYNLDFTDNVEFQSQTPDNYNGTYNRNFMLSVGYALPLNNQ